MSNYSRLGSCVHDDRFSHGADYIKKRMAQTTSLHGNIIFSKLKSDTRFKVSLDVCIGRELILITLLFALIDSLFIDLLQLFVG